MQDKFKFFRCQSCNFCHYDEIFFKEALKVTNSRDDVMICPKCKSRDIKFEKIENLYEERKDK